jgi:hypothetical protein
VEGSGLLDPGPSSSRPYSFEKSESVVVLKTIAVGSE